ncbi:MAG: hypothetical protein WHS89_03595 [Acidimicrobiales bacterium]
MSRNLVRLPLLVMLVAVVAGSAFTFVGCERSPQRSLESFCAHMAEARELDRSLANLDTEQLAGDVDALAAASRVAPGEIAPQVEALVDISEELERTIRTTPGDKTAAVEQLLRAHQTQAEELRAAGVAVETYVEANCGLQLNSTSAPVIEEPVR